MLTAAAVLLHGYHLGVQDQAIYLPAIKKLLDPALYPHDSAFFLSQTRWTWFDEIIAGSVRLAHIPLEWILPLWQVISLFAALLGCWQIAARCFATAAERWGAVGLVAAVMSLPAAGSQIPMLDNHVHPRNFATAAVLLAMAAALDRRWSALGWLALGAVFHPLMAAIGAVHIAIVVMPWPMFVRPATLLAMPFLAWSSSDSAWLQVLQTRRHFFPLRWTWYEWLGVLVPLAFLAWNARRSRLLHQWQAATISIRLVVSTSLFAAAAMLITLIPGLEWLIPTQPLRAMQVTFLFFFFFAGAWIGGYCRNIASRWALFLLPVCGAMVFWQSINYPTTRYFEWPGAAPRGDWLQAFDWVKRNTPRDAYFALDPNYMEQWGNESHGFRALAERSALADYVKDRAVAGLSPELASRWLVEWQATQSFKSFHLEELQSLHQRFGVSWVIVARPAATGLECPWSNPSLAVCRIPEPKAASIQSPNLNW